MPKGFSAIKEAIESFDGRRNAEFEDFQRVLFFKLPNDEDSGVVRCLEQGDDVYGFWYHDFSNVDKKNGWKTKVPCLDQDDTGVPCPGCREDLPRKFQGLINVIWRNGPVFERDEDDRVVKDKNGNIQIKSYEDQVAVWRMGPELFKTLAKKDVSYKGLGSRDIEVVRDGTGLDTSYSVEPADLDAGATKLSKADQTLAEDKYDLEAIAGFVDADKFEEIIEENVGDTSSDENDVAEFLNKDPFGKKEE